MKYVKLELHKEFMMALKSNRKVALSATEKQKGCYVAVETLDWPAGTTRESWFAEVPFPVLLIKQVFKNDDDSTGIRLMSGHIL